MSDAWDAAWETPAREGRLADAIEAYVRQYDWVTFVELGRRLDPYFDLKGSWALEVAPNVILWLGMSQQFVDAVEELRHAKRVWAWPSSFLTYMIDGGGLKLPLAKRIPKTGYKKERWLPVTLRVHEFAKGGHE